MAMKNRTSILFRRFPWIGKRLMGLYRYTQPHYTAGVAGVLLDDQGRVLLVEHVFHLGDPWGLPGGWLGRRENPDDAICREFREETGLEVCAKEVILVNRGAFWGNHLDIAYLLAPLGTLEITYLSFELVNFGWFDLDKLPPIKKFHQDILEEAKRRNLL